MRAVGKGIAVAPCKWIEYFLHALRTRGRIRNNAGLHRTFVGTGNDKRVFGDLTQGNAPCEDFGNLSEWWRIVSQFMNEMPEVFFLACDQNLNTFSIVGNPTSKIKALSQLPDSWTKTDTLDQSRHLDIECLFVGASYRDCFHHESKVPSMSHR